MVFAKHGRSFLGSWWWTIDRLTLVAVVIIIAFSAIMVTTASPAVADRIGVGSYYFVKRQLVFLILSILIITFFSFCSTDSIKKISALGFLFFGFLMLLTLIYGVEIKGARRWIGIGSFSLQPSEFIKPFFAVITGWILSKRYSSRDFPAFRIAILLYLVIIISLFLQPDFGIIVTISCVWGGQLFLAGLSISWILALIITGIFGVTIAYVVLPHVAQRINSFLDPSLSENYQIKKSISAFINGGMFGKGPGEGTVKQFLPDSHTDFIFAVVGEELGVVTCLLVIALFMFIVIRGFIRISNQTDLFSAYSVAGLLMLFGIQSIVNMGVTVHLLPTKGMTLPFISYGGSSIFAVSILIGIILALTKKKFGHKYKFKYRKLPKHDG